MLPTGTEASNVKDFDTVSNKGTNGCHELHLDSNGVALFNPGDHDASCFRWRYQQGPNGGWGY